MKIEALQCHPTTSVSATLDIAANRWASTRAGQGRGTAVAQIIGDLRNGCGCQIVTPQRIGARTI